MNLTDALALMVCAVKAALMVCPLPAWIVTRLPRVVSVLTVTVSPFAAGEGRVMFQAVGAVPLHVMTPPGPAVVFTVPDRPLTIEWGFDILVRDNNAGRVVGLEAGRADDLLVEVEGNPAFDRAGGVSAGRDELHAEEAGHDLFEDHARDIDVGELCALNEGGFNHSRGRLPHGGP